MLLPAKVYRTGGGNKCLHPQPPECRGEVLTSSEYFRGKAHAVIRTAVRVSSMATAASDEPVLATDPDAPVLDTVAPVDFTTHTIINLNTNTITNTDTDTEIESEGEDGKDGKDGKDGEAILEIEYGKPSEFKYVGRDGQPSDVFKPSNNESGGMDDENEGQGEGRSQPLALSDGYYWRCEDKGSLIYREQKGRVVDWGLAWVPEVDGPELSQREKRVRFSGSLDKITTEYEVISVSKFW